MKLKLISFTAISLFTIISACNKDDDTKPKEKDEPVEEEQENLHQPVLEHTEIKLYIPESEDESNPRFMNIVDGTTSSSTSGTIHLAYLFIPDEPDTRHILGSSDNTLIRGLHDISNDNRSAVDFYDIDQNYSTMIYDTITDERSIRDIFDSKASPSDYTSSIRSDQFGWSAGEILGFRIRRTNQYGFIKIVNDPVKVYDLDDNLIDGRIILSIKMEHQEKDDDDITDSE